MEIQNLQDFLKDPGTDKRFKELAEKFLIILAQDLSLSFFHKLLFEKREVLFLLVYLGKIKTLLKEIAEDPGVLDKTFDIFSSAASIKLLEIMGLSIDEIAEQNDMHDVYKTLAKKGHKDLRDNDKLSKEAADDVIKIYNKNVDALKFALLKIK